MGGAFGWVSRCVQPRQYIAPGVNANFESPICSGNVVQGVCQRCHCVYDDYDSEDKLEPPPSESSTHAGTESSGSEESRSSSNTTIATSSHNSTKSAQNYLTWPDYRVQPYPDLKELLEHLGKLKRDSCKIEIFRSSGKDGARWFRCKKMGKRNLVENFETLLDLLRSEAQLMDNTTENHCLDLVQDASDYVIKSLGFYRDITPLFFDIPYSIIQTDGGTKDSAYHNASLPIYGLKAAGIACELTDKTGMFFSFQFLGLYTKAERPFEASRASTSPKFSFSDPKTGVRREWLVSRISLFAKRRSNDTYYSLVYLDPVDTGLAGALKTLLLGNEDGIPLTKSDHITGVISSVIYMMASVSSQFLQDAEEYLQSLTIPDLEKVPSLQGLMETTRKLHELLDLWREARRRIFAVQTLTRDIATHPFIVAEGLRESMEVSLRKSRGMFEYQVDTIDDLVEKTKVHISLIFNIATLYDSRAALEESKAANKFASSVQKITSLTFVYLPIALAASILGMNVDLITGDSSQPTIRMSLVMDVNAQPFNFKSILAERASHALGQISNLYCFLLTLNLANWALDRLVFCGLIGQIFIGTILGTPLLAWLPQNLEASAVLLGYLGLIILVYHGGLGTSFKPLLNNLPLSIAVAITGIGFPIGLSFLLGPIADASSLQCFTAGAALSATSLGTTFTILSTAGFAGTRLGVVLTSAAMMDDVVGLVMVQVVSSLGGGGGVNIASIVRPVGASFGMILGAIVMGWICRRLFGGLKLPHRFDNKGAVWGLQTGVLVACVVVAGYSGASVLFGAFIAGALVTWWDEARDGAKEASERSEETTGAAIYDVYFSSLVESILIPFFFASIGLSIPIKSLFRREIIWRGIVYSILMFVAKLVTGVWILLVDLPFKTSKLLSFWTKEAGKSEPSEQNNEISKQQKGSSKDEGGITTNPPDTQQSSNAPNESADEWEDITPTSRPTVTPSEETSEQVDSKDTSQSATEPSKSGPETEIPRPPISVYPCLILGLAMISRGEIAFLIASIASANGIFQNPTTTRDLKARADAISGEADGDIFLIVIWAAMLCTILGPLGVGLLVRRVKRLEGLREGTKYNGQGVLGVWSVIAKKD
ncbi:hypothetical protein TWF192_000877 [Orbilia oligospora]|uniref:Cation/H+ exchanger transmembrane domain-containing protein n=2 Tax=Orbilia oligospora TaxID=2813651 RepID=A0A6G1MGF5_ORBOL|nr:hypothetical protein TWF191_008878 [Orbilia oligospora]KAF3257584.1 hypothetical protein TWF192_000877 [Orbilia oligospora]